MSSLEMIPRRYQEGARNTGMTIAGMDHVLLAAHVHLDGDALGSLGGMAYILQSLGRRFAIYSSTGVPDSLDFLVLPGKVYRDLNSIPFEPKSAVYLDCGEPARLGDELGPKASTWPSVNIDHHLGDKGLGSIANFIEPSAAATAQLVAYVAESLNLPLIGSLAECIALGLMTDTGGFCHGNTTADVFCLCAALANNGCDINSLREQLQNNWTIGRVHLWGSIFTNAFIRCGGRVIFGGVRLEDLRKFRCAREDTEGCVEWLRRVRGTEIAAILREDGNDTCKFSLRSWGKMDVRAIAAELGGGGHRNAAGGALRMPYEEAEEILVETLENALYCCARYKQA